MLRRLARAVQVSRCVAATLADAGARRVLQRAHHVRRRPSRLHPAIAAFSTSAISAEPTTAASAIPPSTVTCVGNEMPNPTAIGNAVNFRARRTSAGNSAGSASRVPVTPVREIRYRNPVDAAAICASRASVDVGAARKIVSRPRALKYRAIFGGFFGRQISNEHAVGAGFGGGVRKFLEAHLQNRIEVAEKHQRNLRISRAGA